MVEHQLFDSDTVVDYLARRGLLNEQNPSVSELSGGVSNAVIAVGDGPGGVVVKQALAQLRVAEQWTAPRRRVLLEARALQLLHDLTPHAVPRVVHIDEESLTIVIDRAPSAWRNWRGELLHGRVDPDVARQLGMILRTWHDRTGPGGITLEPSAIADGRQAFEALRVEPFYRSVARRVPAVAAVLTSIVEEMETRQHVLVHGDFTPKNVLVAPDGSRLWVVDLEVAHLGDPLFDVASMLAHLQLKAIALPESASRFDRQTTAFLRAYAAPSGFDADDPYLLAHIGALLLARVHGKSPASYLSEAGREHADRLGRAMVLGDVHTIPEAIASREEAL